MGESARNSTRVAETEIPESSITSFSKKMDFDFEEFNSPSLNLKLQPHRCTDTSPQKVVSPGNSSNPSGVLTGFSSCGDSPVLSCCSSNAPVQVVKDSLRFLDLEAKSPETESSTCNDRKFSRETTPSSDFHGSGTDHMDTPAAIEKMESLRPRDSQAVKMPSQAEIDEFFTGAEREEQRRFAEKYNYDVVMDLPMEGRYQWICLKP
ncbi:cyclin-dependent kinase inhibitor 7-like isoform X1 [Populus nigra]|uniref:cyclin-dependent kinase inhibitor 7-like isoform X1 n=1 Tax=Populus nigra TaxID=3691 RepID=UPI002B26F83A|nr:cyclin-dependent kinase inhibitor 7-like isoform X1 [Populus nigra]